MEGFEVVILILLGISYFRIVGLSLLVDNDSNNHNHSCINTYLPTSTTKPTVRPTIKPTLLSSSDEETPSAVTYDPVMVYPPKLLPELRRAAATVGSPEEGVADPVNTADPVVTDSIVTA